jgi:AraC family transcriptional activator of pobA
MELNVLTLSDNNNNHFALRIADLCSGETLSELKQYPCFSMVLVTSGSGKVVRDGAVFSFKCNSLLCFSLYQPFAIQPDDELKGILINFHPGFFCLFKHRNEVSCNGVLFNNIYDTPMVELSDTHMQALLVVAGQIRNELSQHRSPDQDLLISYLKIFLITASRVKLEQQKLTADNLKKQTPLSTALTSAIEKDFRTHHNPGDYGEMLNVSTFVLNRISKTHYHKTLSGLIADRLIVEAKRQLYLTSKQVKEIAFELGYKDEFYFSRFFKKNVGVSPQIFRDTVSFDKVEG